MGTVSSAAVVPPRHWPFFLIGVLLFAAGPVAYFVQFRLHFLKMPWYAPALATAGVLLMAVSVWEHRGVWRSVGLAAIRRRVRPRMVPVAGRYQDTRLHRTRPGRPQGPRVRHDAHRRRAVH